MRLSSAIAALFLLCALATAPARAAEDKMDIFDHADTRAQVSPEFTADFQPGIEELFLLTAADEPNGEGVKRKLLNNLKAMLGRESIDGEDSGTQPDTDLNERREHFSKDGWKGYLSFVREANIFLKKLSQEYGMGSGIIIMTGSLAEGTEKYYNGPEDRDLVVFTAKGSFSCRASDTMLCDQKFRVFVTYGPSDAEGFGDVVIRGWRVDFLNDKGRMIRKD